LRMRIVTLFVHKLIIHCFQIFSPYFF
jgi:hypothetical protein